MNARFFFMLAVPLLLVPACGGEDDGSKPAGTGTSGSSSGDAAAPVCPAAPASEKPAASCEVTIESPFVSSSPNHVPEGTAITYCSNPPAGGDHYPVWADFKEYSAPVEWPYLVHSMEHGAVVLLYKCDPPGCPEIVSQLQRVRDNAAADPLCAQGTKRIIIMPSTTIPTKVSATAWGKTYRAACIDEPTLSAFVRDNYAKGPENLCAAGRSF